ncbi:hypothetical protein C0992_001239 [Termitomyces sp. T32_za158]|nr:hypothetical protein C0992_001239 [Termitomyces sp. T32_za158]
MRRFLVGDELGNIKSISFSPDVPDGTDKTSLKMLRNGTSDAVEVLGVGPPTDGVGSQLVCVIFVNFGSGRLTRSFQAKIVAGFSSGLASSFSLDHSNGDQLQEVFQWKETRLRDGQKYIGLDVSEKFAYGGDDVDVSVWDTERAFIPQTSSSESQGKKRKRDALFTGELWRAKNVQNDNLGLRQPVRITSLTYLATSPTSHHMAAGTGLGNVRRYDTQASKRPVSDWKIAKVGGIGSLEQGMSEQ